MSDDSHENSKSPEGGSGEFASVVSAYLDNQLSEEASERLLAELKTDARKRHIFVAVAMQARMIREIASERLSEEQEGLSLTMPRPVKTDEVEDFPHVPDDRRSVLMDALDQEREARHKREATEAIEREKRKSAERDRQESLKRLYGMSRPQSQSHTRHYVIPKPLFYGSIAAAIAIAVLLIVPFFEKGENGRTQIAENPGNSEPDVTPAPPIVASLHADAGAVWAEGTLTPNEKDQMIAAAYRLGEGYIELDFKEGARVVIEGPAEFDLLSAHRMRLFSGRVTGLVNKGAEGFTVLTPHATLIDLGTEFGVDVSTEHGTDLHVFGGKVSIAGSPESGSASRQQIIGKGEARRVDIRTSKIVEIDVQHDEFLRSGDVEQLAKVSEKERARLARLMKLRHDPTLVACFDFENNDESIVNTVERVGGRYNPARGIRRVKGAYGESQALQLNGIPVHMGTDVGDALGKTKTVTVSFWAKWRRPQWKGLLQIGIAPDGRSELTADAYDTHAYWTVGIPGSNVRTTDHVGRPAVPIKLVNGVFHNDEWRHFTMIFDGDAASANCRVYLNGELVSKAIDASGELDLTGARMTLGTFSHPDFTDVIPFVGEIDDLMIWGRVLSEDEIRDLALTE